VRADRLLTLLLILHARGRTTARDLAGELGVSVRTVYRDLEALSVAGVPVWAEGGPGGGCQLLDGYRSPLVGISAEEAIALLASSTSAAAHSSLGADLATAQLRLLASMPAGTRREVAAQAARFHVDTPPWFRPPRPAPQLDTLVGAVRTEHRLRVNYADRRGRTQLKVVDPWGLVVKAGHWYLVAAAGSGPVVYRADRLTEAEELPELFQRPDHFDLAAFWRSWSEEFESGLNRVTVAVRIDPELWGSLPQIFGEAVLPKMESAEGPDATGWRQLDLSFESESAARTRILGLGAQAEVIAPAAVRGAVGQAAAEVAQLYRS
jgi:predicted DNA-binding transcriptional regulator YafY